jgi:hypothetical protein
MSKSIVEQYRILTEHFGDFPLDKVALDPWKEKYRQQLITDVDRVLRNFPTKPFSAIKAEELEKHLTAEIPLDKLFQAK